MTRIVTPSQLDAVVVTQTRLLFAFSYPLDSLSLKRWSFFCQVGLMDWIECALLLI